MEKSCRFCNCRVESCVQQFGFNINCEYCGILQQRSLLYHQFELGVSNCSGAMTLMSVVHHEIYIRQICHKLLASMLLFSR